MIIKIRKIIRLLVSAAIHPSRALITLKKLRQKRTIDKSRKSEYKDWFKKNYPTQEELDLQLKLVENLKNKPLVSILLPIYNTNEEHLSECIKSVISQTYTNWELCIADDASTTAVLDVVKGFAKEHDNVKYVRLDKNQHIAASSNEALKLAKGDFVALLDHDDFLWPNALYEMVATINETPDLDLIYSDEDKIEENGEHCEPFFKPDWSPDFLRSCNYITHFAFMRRSLLKSIGGFKLGTEGAQDWDLFLRLTEKSDRIHHIPKVLYSWRKSSTSTAKTAQSKPYAYINQQRVLRDSLLTIKNPASVFASVFSGFWRVKYHIQGLPLVSIVIPTKDNYELLKNCLESIIENTNYPNFEIIIVDTGSTDKKVEELYDSKIIKTNSIKVIRWGKPFNFSEVCNEGAANSKGEYLVFLNDDTSVITSEWIEGLLEHAQRDEVGMVGCKLLFENGSIQHAGVVVSSKEVAFHPFYGGDPSLDIFTNIYISNIRNCSAVTAACSMVAKKKFDQVGGFDEQLRVTYNDVDICLKLLSKGYNNVYTPYTELFHYESMSVGKINTNDRDKEELNASQEIMKKRWGEMLRRDPYYNENFISQGPGYKLD